MESIRRRVHDRNGSAEVITKEDIYTSRQNQSWQKRVGKNMGYPLKTELLLQLTDDMGCEDLADAVEVLIAEYGIREEVLKKLQEE